MSDIRRPDASAGLHGHLSSLHLSLRSCLGRGGYGVIFYAIDTSTNTPCAVKMIRHRNNDINHWEASVHKIVNGGPNIVALLGVSKYQNILLLNLQLCSSGKMSDFIKTGRYFKNTPLVASHLSQLLDAVQYCHNQGVYHYDTKPE